MIMPMPYVPYETPIQTGLNTATNMLMNMQKFRLEQQEARTNAIKNSLLAPQLQSDIAYKNALTSEIPYHEKLLHQQVVENAIRNKLLGPQLEQKLKLLQFSANNPLTTLPGQAGQIGAANALLRQGAATPQTIQENQIPMQAATGVAPAVPALETQEGNDILASMKAQNELAKAKENYYTSGGFGRGGVGLKAIQAVKNQIKTEHPDWPDQKVNDAQSNYLAGNTTFSDGTPLPSASGTLDLMISQAQNAGIPARVKISRRAALDLKDDFDEAEAYLPKIAQYAGFFGWFRRGGKIAETMSGLYPEAWAAYQYFTNKLVPTMSTEMVPTLYTTTTDERIRTLTKKLNNSDDWKTNPKIFIENFKRLKELYDKRVIPNKALTTSGVIRRLKGNSSSLPTQSTSNNPQKVISFEEWSKQNA